MGREEDNAKSLRKRVACLFIASQQASASSTPPLQHHQPHREIVPAFHLRVARTSLSDDIVFGIFTPRCAPGSASPHTKTSPQPLGTAPLWRQKNSIWIRRSTPSPSRSHNFDPSLLPRTSPTRRLPRNRISSPFSMSMLSRRPLRS